jgi:phage gpG-like protein
MAKDFNEGDKIRRWKTNLENPEPALKGIGAMMVSESQRAFTEQKFGEDEWRPRAVPNIAGIISDFHAGKREPPKRRFEDRPALVDTGALKGPAGIVFKVMGNVVVVGSNRPGVGTLHKGGKVESLPITASVQELLGKWLAGKGSKWADKLGFLLNEKWTGKTRKMKVPKRPIVGLTEQTIEDIREIIGVEVFEVE